RWADLPFPSGRAAARRIAVLNGAFRLPLRAPRLLEGEYGTRGFPARQQIRTADAAGVCAVQFGEQRAARIRCDGGDRSEAGTDAEPVQGERSFGFPIKGHAPLSFRRDATAL